MAHQRNSSQRRLPSLTRILLVTVLVASAAMAGCNARAPARWSSALGDGAALERITVRDAASVLEVDVHLPAGHEPAEDFVQRATLHLGMRANDAIRLEQTGLSQSFVFEVPPANEWDAAQATLELLVGFCEPEAKEVCYIDMDTIEVVPATDVDELQEVIFTAERPE